MDHRRYNAGHYACADDDKCFCEGNYGEWLRGYYGNLCGYPICCTRHGCHRHRPLGILPWRKRYGICGARPELPLE